MKCKKGQQINIKIYSLQHPGTIDYGNMDSYPFV